LVDGIPVIAAVRSGGLMPSDPSVAVELLAFNASVQRAGEQTGHQFLLLRGNLVRGGVGLLPRGLVRYPRAKRRCGALSRASAGRPRARQRLLRGFEGVRMGCTVEPGRGPRAKWASLSPFLSFGSEGDRRPLWVWAVDFDDFYHQHSFGFHSIGAILL